MEAAYQQLSGAIAEFVDDAGVELVDRVASALERGAGVGGVVVATGVAAGRLRNVTRIAAGAQVEDGALALALRSAKASDVRASQGGVDVVWTGPPSRSVPTRRTRQLLEDLIRGAERDVWIVSYHVLGARSVLDAALERARDGVRVKILVETVAEGARSMTHVEALGADLANACELYEWPLENRLEFSGGSPWVTLHAKATVCDGRELFVTSANMTSRAMDRNMELGLHVSGGNAPRRVADHFDALVADGVIVPLDPAQSCGEAS